MALFDWLTKRSKPLSQMTRQELRRQELLLARDRDQLLKRINESAALKTTEQLMMARQLNIRTKEYLTVTRMRMLRENADKAKAMGSKLGMIGEKDLIALEKMIENDNITAEMYQDRLDSMLQVGSEEGESLLTPGSKQVLDIWEQMDTGLIADAGQAFDEADRRVRERHKASE
ncbi:MAG: hypothetical protein DCC65_04095 [Planctomycetota bacterium]|nr:MAG: hypothetical protein DCC65_04095 [Planctomycetota bacterium]